MNSQYDNWIAPQTYSGWLALGRRVKQGEKATGTIIRRLKNGHSYREKTFTFAQTEDASTQLIRGTKEVFHPQKQTAQEYLRRKRRE